MSDNDMILDNAEYYNLSIEDEISLIIGIIHS